MALGAVFGGYLAANHFGATDGNIAHISAASVESLQKLGFEFPDGHLPLVPEFYQWSALFTGKGLLIIVGGGFLIGLVPVMQAASRRVMPLTEYQLCNWVQFTLSLC